MNVILDTCGLRTCKTGKGEENNDAKREKVGEFVGFWGS